MERKSISLFATDDGLIRMVKEALEPAGFLVLVTRQEQGLTPEPELYSPRGNTYRGEMDIAKYCNIFGLK